MRKAVAIDANLLVLLVVGLADAELVARHRRLKTFTADDLALLELLIEESAGVVVTPNTLTEASNHLRNIEEPSKTRISLVFRNFISNVQEVYVTSADASARDEFLWLGLSDASLLEVAREEVVVLSTDANLCIAAANAGYEAVNFNHLRDL
jgi:hypothetical protein